jgi:hypothetical protein
MRILEFEQEYGLDPTELQIEGSSIKTTIDAFDEGREALQFIDGSTDIFDLHTSSQHEAEFRISYLNSDIYEKLYNFLLVNTSVELTMIENGEDLFPALKDEPNGRKVKFLDCIPEGEQFFSEDGEGYSLLIKSRGFASGGNTETYTPTYQYLIEIELNSASVDGVIDLVEVDTISELNLVGKYNLPADMIPYTIPFGERPRVYVKGFRLTGGVGSNPIVQGYIYEWDGNEFWVMLPEFPHDVLSESGVDPVWFNKGAIWVQPNQLDLGTFNKYMNVYSHNGTTWDLLQIAPPVSRYKNIVRNYNGNEEETFKGLKNSIVYLSSFQDFGYEGNTYYSGRLNRESVKLPKRSISINEGPAVEKLEGFSFELINVDKLHWTSIGLNFFVAKCTIYAVDTEQNKVQKLRSGYNTNNSVDYENYSFDCEPILYLKGKDLTLPDKIVSDIADVSSFDEYDDLGNAVFDEKNKFADDPVPATYGQWDYAFLKVISKASSKFVRTNGQESFFVTQVADGSASVVPNPVYYYPNAVWNDWIASLTTSEKSFYQDLGVVAELSGNWYPVPPQYKNSTCVILDLNLSDKPSDIEDLINARTKKIVYARISGKNERVYPCTIDWGENTYRTAGFDLSNYTIAQRNNLLFITFLSSPSGEAIISSSDTIEFFQLDMRLVYDSQEFIIDFDTQFGVKVYTYDSDKASYNDVSFFFEKTGSNSITLKGANYYNFTAREIYSDLPIPTDVTNFTFNFSDIVRLPTKVLKPKMESIIEQRLFDAELALTGYGNPPIQYNNGDTPKYIRMTKFPDTSTEYTCFKQGCHETVMYRASAPSSVGAFSFTANPKGKAYGVGFLTSFSARKHKRTLWWHLDETLSTTTTANFYMTSHFNTQVSGSFFPQFYNLCAKVSPMNIYRPSYVDIDDSMCPFYLSYDPNQIPVEFYYNGSGGGASVWSFRELNTFASCYSAFMVGDDTYDLRNYLQLGYLSPWNNDELPNNLLLSGNYATTNRKNYVDEYCYRRRISITIGVLGELPCENSRNTSSSLDVNFGFAPMGSFPNNNFFLSSEFKTDQVVPKCFFVVDSVDLTEETKAKMKASDGANILFARSISIVPHYLSASREKAIMYDDEYTSNSLWSSASSEWDDWAVEIKFILRHKTDPSLDKNLCENQVFNQYKAYDTTSLATRICNIPDSVGGWDNFYKDSPDANGNNKNEGVTIPLTLADTEADEGRAIKVYGGKSLFRIIDDLYENVIKTNLLDSYDKIDMVVIPRAQSNAPDDKQVCGFYLAVDSLINRSGSLLVGGGSSIDLQKVGSNDLFLELEGESSITEDDYFGRCYASRTDYDFNPFWNEEQTEQHANNPLTHLRNMVKDTMYSKEVITTTSHLDMFRTRVQLTDKQDILSLMEDFAKNTFSMITFDENDNFVVKALSLNDSATLNNAGVLTYDPVVAFNSTNIIKDSLSNLTFRKSSDFVRKFKFNFHYVPAPDKTARRIEYNITNSSIEVKGLAGYYYDKPADSVADSILTQAIADDLRNSLYDKAETAKQYYGTVLSNEKEFNLEWLYDFNSNESILTAKEVIKRYIEFFLFNSWEITFTIPLKFCIYESSIDKPSDKKYIDIGDFVSVTDWFYTDESTMYGYISAIAPDLYKGTAQITVFSPIPPEVQQLFFDTIWDASVGSIDSSSYKINKALTKYQFIDGSDGNGTYPSSGSGSITLSEHGFIDGTQADAQGV